MSIHLRNTIERCEMRDELIKNMGKKQVRTTTGPIILPTIKIIKAMQMAPRMDRHEVDRFLAESKTPLRLATTNTKGVTTSTLYGTRT